MTQSDLDPTAWIVESGVAYATLDLAIAAASNDDHILCSEGKFTLASHTKAVTISGVDKTKTVIAMSGTVIGSCALATFMKCTLKYGATPASGIIKFDEVDRVHLIDVDVHGYDSLGTGVECESCQTVSLDDVTFNKNATAFQVTNNGTTTRLTVSLKRVSFLETGVAMKFYGTFFDNRGMDVILDELVVIGTGLSGAGLIWDDGDYMDSTLKIWRSKITGVIGANAVSIDGGKYIELCDNDIFGNLNGLSMGSTEPTSYWIKGNRIYDNAYDVVEGWATGTLDVEYNWFGTDSPVSGQFQGTVDYTPWLNYPTVDPDILLQIANGVWTAQEKSYIRDALGVAGTKTEAVDGQLQDKAESTEVADLITRQKGLNEIHDDLATHEANLTTHEGNLSTHDGNLTTHDGNLSTVEGNLTNEIDANETKIDAMQGDITTIGTAVGDIDSDLTELKDSPDITVRTPAKVTLPYPTPTTLTEDMTIDASSFTVADCEDWPEEGAVRVEAGANKENIYYTSRDVDTGVVTVATGGRGQLNTSAAVHLSGSSVTLLSLCEIWLTHVDKDGTPVAPEAGWPSLSVTDPIDGDSPSIEGAGTFTSLGSYGAYFKTFGIPQDIDDALIRLRIQTKVGTQIQDYFRTVPIVPEPLAYADYIEGEGLLGEYDINQDGWYNSQGVLQEWGDDGAGYLRDPVSGEREDDVEVTAHLVINGDPTRGIKPPLKVYSDEYGNWEGKLGAGTFDFTFYKDKKRFLGPFRRTIG